MQPRHAIPVAIVLLLPALSFGKRRKPPVDPTPTTLPTNQLHPPPLSHERPVSVALLPDGLANVSAQGCGSCHVEIAAAWSTSAHAGPPPTPLVHLAAQLDDPTCTSCHLPLVEQQPDEDGWSPTLHAEGVTCAACHVDAGLVLGPRASAQAPHALGAAPGLTSPGFCATCHELTLPGAEAPLYDTVSAWQATRYAELGIGCQDCHQGPGVGWTRPGADHSFTADLGRALSVLVDADAPALVRGAPGPTLHLTLQNTGAGHHVPSGSPWTGLELQVDAVPPLPDEGEPHPPVELLRTFLGRTLAEDSTTVAADTRLAAGATLTADLVPNLPIAAPPGTWTLRMRFVETVNGAPQPDRLRLERTVPLPVE